MGSFFLMFQTNSGLRRSSACAMHGIMYVGNSFPTLSLVIFLRIYSINLEVCDNIFFITSFTIIYCLSCHDAFPLDLLSRGLFTYVFCINIIFLSNGIFSMRY